MAEREKPPLWTWAKKVFYNKPKIPSLENRIGEKPDVKFQENILSKESTIFTAESAEKTSFEPLSELKTKIVEHTTAKKELSGIKKRTGEKLSRWADIAGAWLFLSLTEHQIIRQIKPEYSDGFEEKFIEIMKDRNVVPMLIANHESLADVISIALISNRLTKLINKARGVDDELWKVIINDLKNAFAGNLLKEQPADKKEFPGWVLTMAKSLEAGNKGQGEFIQALTGQINSWLRSNSVTVDGYVRKKDEKKYNLPRKNIGHLRRLINSIENGEGRAMFPQGSVESGRLMTNNKDNKIPDKNVKLTGKILRFTQGTFKGISLVAREIIRSTLPREAFLVLEKLLKENAPPIKGMQKFDEDVKFDKILEIAHNAGKKMVFIVAANSGAPKIIDHNTNQPIPTWEAWLANLNPLTPVIQTLLDLILLDVKIKGLMDVKVGMPIRDTDMIKEIMENRKDPALRDKEPTSGEFSDYLGRKIAILLPEYMRKVYR